MEQQFIKVRGARQHNLKNINLDIPKYKLVVFTGLSGSGKSSLAFDTIYAEGQRRYVESLSAYARQFLGVMDKPDVDTIDGLSPAISIDQKSTSRNPRSTVGTVTEIYDYLRLLFARIGHPHCPKCGREITRQSPEHIVQALLKFISEQFQARVSKQLRLLIMAPIIRDRKGEFSALLANLKSKGFSKARIDGHVLDLNEELVLIKTNKHSIEAIIDRIAVSKSDFKDLIFVANLKTRLTDAVEQATTLADGLAIISLINDASWDLPDKPQKMTDQLYSERFACPVCNISLPEIEPRIFSFNSPHGACPKCSGIGTLLKIDPDLVFNPNLTISEGGILPYAKMFFHETWWSRLLKTVAREQNIDLRIPIRNLPDAAKNKLLYGTGDEIYAVEGENRFGRATTIHEIFEGILGDLERKHSETESDFVRFELEKFMRKETCPLCLGKRLKLETLQITILGKSIVDITDLAISQADEWINKLVSNLISRETTIAKPIVKEISTRLKFLLAVGLEYLTLGRNATSLSGGEAQRIRLASQIGSGLSGVLYVLDEPSIGLHPKDNHKLIETLKSLRDLGNTVIVVEHDREVMQNADLLYDFGPGAGEQGGKIIFSGSYNEILQKSSSVTSKYLKNPQLIKFPLDQGISTNFLILKGASQNNLKNIEVSLPLGKLICVTGVSGSGKSTLIVETLYHAIMLYFNPFHREKPGAHTSLMGLENLDKVILVDQSPIGRSPRSNPATYTGLYTHIRDLFAALPDAKTRGFGPGRFSFNVKGGRCESCQGEGQIKIEMQFLADVYVDCEVCHGKRFNSETLEIHYKGKHIADVLDMTVTEAVEFFQNHHLLHNKLETLGEVGLTYIHLGQPAPTLSGGEAQRVKLAAELGKRQTGKTLYILDEPTTGLHFADLHKLLNILKKLTGYKNTVVVIEHNMDIIKNADYVIDLGPGGGDAGGFVVATGSPKDLTSKSDSFTGQWLKKLLAYN